MNVLIFTDNRFQSNRLGILRAPGAHRIATQLRSQNIHTDVVDFYLDWSGSELKEIIDHTVTDSTLFVGFSCSLMFDGIEEFATLRDYIRTKNPKTAIVVGGYGTTQKGFDGADWYIEGYGEYATTALVEHLKDPNCEIKYQLDELGRKVIYTKEHYPVNKLTSLNIKYQPSDFIQSNEVLSLETARGCIFKCKFCSFQLLGKSKLDYLRDPREIKEELINNYQQYGTTRYIITEDTFNDSDEKVDMFYEIVKSLPFKLNFMGYTRADLLASKPYNMDKLVDAGFTNMHFGIETFNESAGRSIGKGMSGDKLKEVLVKFKQNYPQLYLNATFIAGLPGETEQDIRSAAEWVITSKCFDFWTFNPLMIPTKNKLIYSSEFTDNYLMYGYTKMSEQEIEQANVNMPALLYGTKILPHMILWKNQNFNYFTAAKLSHELNQQANAHKKVDAWTTFAISGLGIMPLDQVQTHSYSGTNPLDQEYVNTMTVAFINQYKQSKLEYFAKEFDKPDIL